MNETTTAAPKTYRSSTGRDIPLPELPDTYLVNIIRKIEKGAALAGFSDPSADNPLYPDLLAELKTRPQQTQDFYLERRKAGK